MPRDRLVCGLKKECKQQRLFTEDDTLTLEKAIDIAQTIVVDQINIRSRRVSSYRCKGKHSSQNCPFKEKECFFCHKKGNITKVCKAKNNSSVQRKANLVQEAESDEDKVINGYHQRVIGGKIVPPVANLKIEKENVPLEICTGDSVGIFTELCKFFSNCKESVNNNLICRNSSVNLLSISSKLRSYSGELIHPLGKIVCKENYNEKLFHDSFIIM